MADEPDDLTLQLRRGIRQSQTEQGDRLAPIEQRMDERHETMSRVPCFAMHANLRHDAATSRLSPLEQRVRPLDDRV